MGGRGRGRGEGGGGRREARSSTAVAVTLKKESKSISLQRQSLSKQGGGAIESRDAAPPPSSLSTVLNIPRGVRNPPISRE